VSFQKKRCPRCVVPKTQVVGNASEDVDGDVDEEDEEDEDEDEEELIGAQIGRSEA
jgi:hypothetical protein